MTEVPEMLTAYGNLDATDRVVGITEFGRLHGFAAADLVESPGWLSRNRQKTAPFLAAPEGNVRATL